MSRQIRAVITISPFSLGPGSSILKFSAFRSLKSSIRKHPYYLNGRFLFLLFSQLMLAIAYFARNTMLDRFAVHR